MSRPAPSLSRERSRVGRYALLTLLVLLVVAAAPTLQRLLRDPAAGRPVVDVNRITVTNDAFNPPAVQVSAGTTVTWTFDDGGRQHNVVGDGWSSDVVAIGTYDHTFTEPGTYPYRCTLHWGMEGRVDVAQR